MARAQAWILGRPSRDAALILFPGLAGLGLSLVVREGSPASTLYAFFAVVLIDSGHVYTTAWRTWLRKPERQSHPLYWMTPLLIVGGICLWMWWQIPYLWAFVVYATVFHHVRQFYGMLRWYQRLNGRRCAPSAFFLYALTALPFLLFHFRPLGDLQPRGIYTDQDLFFFFQPELFQGGIVCYGLVVFAWLVFEWRLWHQGAREWNRFAAVLGPAVLYASCFLLGDSLPSIVFPLLLSHGIPYLAMMSLSLTRLSPQTFSPMLKASGVVLLTAAVFGVFEWVYEEQLLTMSNAYLQTPIGAWEGLLTAVYLVPLLAHFVFDAYLWTGRHREAKLVYALPTGLDPRQA